MKKVLLVLGVLVLIGVAVVGLAVYRANDLIAKFKPQLETALGNAVGAHVSLGELDVSIVPDTKLKASKVSIKQKGDSSEGLILDNLVLSLNLMELLSGKLAVSKLELDSPSITIVKTASGTSIEGLGKPPNNAHAEKRPREREEKSPAEGGSAISINANDIAVRNGTIVFKDTLKKIEYRVSSLQVKASLSIASPYVELPTWTLDLQLPGNVPVSVSGKGTKLNQAENTLELGEITTKIASGAVVAKGQVGLSQSSGTVVLGLQDLAPVTLLPAAKPFVPDTDPFVPLVPVIKSLSGKLDLASQNFLLENTQLLFPGGVVTASGSILLPKASGSLAVSAEKFDLSTVPEMLKNQVPILGQYGLKGSASPKLDVTLNESGVGIRGPIELQGVDATLPGTRPMHFSNGSGTLKATVLPNNITIETKDFGISINGSPLSASTTLHQKPTSTEIPFLNVAGFGGSIDGTLSLRNDEQKSFSTVIDMKKLDISQLLAIVDATKASTISGTLNAFKGRLSGSLNPGGPQSWVGSGGFEVVNGLVKDVNIPGVVLQKIDKIPLMNGALAAYVPERFKPVVSSKDTPIKRLNGTFDVMKGLATIKELNFESDHFSLLGDGTYNLTGPMNINATILFSKEFSAALVASAKEIRNVLDGDGKLVVPLTVSGVAPSLNITPNTAKLLELAAKGALRTQAGDALEKTIEKKLGPGAGKDVRKTLENLLNF